MLYEARWVRQRDGMETRKGVVEMDGEAMGGRFFMRGQKRRHAKGVAAVPEAGAA